MLMTNRSNLCSRVPDGVHRHLSAPARICESVERASSNVQATDLHDTLFQTTCDTFCVSAWHLSWEISLRLAHAPVRPSRGSLAGKSGKLSHNAWALERWKILDP